MRDENPKPGLTLACLLLPAACLLLYGCGPRRRSQPIIKPAPKPPDASQTASGAQARQGLTFQWREKLPNGALRQVLDLQAASAAGSVQSESGELKDTKGTLFRDNRPRARFVAPVVHADRKSGTVVAEGGVKVTSVDPPGTSVTAKTITWNADKNVIVARGDVRFEDTSRKPRSWGGPFDQITVDLEWKQLTIP